jgi:hypothetical protein
VSAPNRRSGLARERIAEATTALSD